MPDGWGIAEVRLVFDAKEVPGGTREAGPYAWNVGLPTGGYLVSALAIDHAGNEAYAAPIAIGVNQPAPVLPEEETTGGLETTGEPTSTGEPPTTGGAEPSDTTDSDSSSSTGASEASTTTAADSDDGGCGCRQHDSAAGALGLLALLGRRRRKSPRP
ncbi:MYXO-CTERM sorting domain-containing protein [Nannocystis sp. ILAH1]|uniref:MYXO-CTERM sorting domain-containing protein n=1 Tax=unclassified Nannocystis TaxID=2627009 RepID=UPI0022716E0D|nr:MULTISPECIES: MYXO-CTERM sorting domain-containing protein [unclassified Nannocystis]MCY0993941.1 MYXO-CTERM sorting domain-containing protein [Nannocystis sp. ILAH1]MCY1066907.1 MYXO-CTERM sorting domain-containing protein [Nannocystis sp. RBIL2]